MTCNKWSLFLERIPGIFTLSLENHWKHISSQIWNICFFDSLSKWEQFPHWHWIPWTFCVHIKSNDFYSTWQSSFWIVFTFCWNIHTQRTAFVHPPIFKNTFFKWVKESEQVITKVLNSLWSTCLIAFVRESKTMRMEDGSNFQIGDTLNQFHWRQSFIDNPMVIFYHRHLQNVKFHMQCISNLKNNCCSFVMGSRYNAFYSCERPEKRNCINFISYAYKLFYQFGQKEWSTICNESLCMTTWEMTIFIQKDMTRVTTCHGKRS